MFLKPGSKPVVCTQEKAVNLGTQFIRNTSTFVFDGVENSIRLIKAEQTENGSVWNLSYIYRTKHPGHGDRSHQVLVEQVTEHYAQITLRGCQIVSATCDKNYNLLTSEQIK